MSCRIAVANPTFFDRSLMSCISFLFVKVCDVNDVLLDLALGDLEWNTDPVALSGEKDPFLKGVIELDRNITGEGTATDDNSKYKR